jgi:hypothetical protein
LVSLGGRTTCVKCPFQVSRSNSRDLVSYGSFFPLGQSLEGEKVSKEVELSWEKVRMGLGRLGGSNLLIATLTSTH